MTSTTHASPELVQALKKRIKTEEEVHFIAESLKSFHFFKDFVGQQLGKFSQADMFELCKGFSYEQFNAGDIVFEKGDESNNKFYIIMDGQVSIVFPHKEKPIQKPKITETPMKNARRRSLLPTLSSPLANKLQRKKTRTIQDEDEVQTSDKPLLRKASTVTALLSSMAKPEQERVLTEQIDTMSDEDIDPSNASQIMKDLEAFAELEQIIEAESQMPTHISIQPETVEQTIAKYGRVIKHLGNWESFGEIALRDNKPRLASVICDTDCEFIIVSKEQFDRFFLKQEFAKINLAKDMLPFLGHVSSHIKQYILHSLKAQQYEKGTYLTLEDEPIDNSSKIFMVYDGNCIVEKRPLYCKIQAGSDYLRPIQIAVIGKGEFVGEEAATGAEQYTYSVRVLSKSAIVYTITKNHFALKLLRDFSELLARVYKDKKERRDLFLLNHRRNLESESEQNADVEINREIPSINNMNFAAATKRRQSFRILSKIDLTPSRQNTDTTGSVSRSPSIRDTDSQLSTPRAPKKIQTSIEEIVPKEKVAAIKKKLHVVRSVELKKTKSTSEGQQRQSLGLIEQYTDKKRLRRKSKFFTTCNNQDVPSPRSSTMTEQSVVLNPNSEPIPLRLIKAITKGRPLRKSCLFEEAHSSITDSTLTPTHAISPSMRFSTACDEEFERQSSSPNLPNVKIRSLTFKSHSSKNSIAIPSMKEEPLHSLAMKNSSINFYNRKLGSISRTVVESPSSATNNNNSYLPPIQLPTHQRMSTFSDYYSGRMNTDSTDRDGHCMTEPDEAPTCSIAEFKDTCMKSNIFRTTRESDFNTDNDLTIRKSVTFKNSGYNIRSIDTVSPKHNYTQLKNAAESHRKIFKKTARSIKVEADSGEDTLNFIIRSNKSKVKA